jgi:hypothetical protein
MLKLFSLFLSVSLSLLIASCSTGSTAEQQAAKVTAEKKAAAEKAVKTTTYVTMPGNTAIAVSLANAIDTDVQITGAEFQATLSRSIVVDGHTLFADGAGAKGVLNKVVQSGHLKTPAELNFSLTAIQDKGGRWINVGTNQIQEKKASHTNREVAMIGGGAVVGGIIGKIIDRKNSTEIGAAAGAAAGTVAAVASGKQDILHPAGTEVVFYSSQSTQIALR